MGCTCKKNLNNEEEIKFEKENELNEASKTKDKENLNYSNINNMNNKNQNILLWKKSKTLQNTTSKEENTNQIKNFFTFERENSRNTFEYKQIETNFSLFINKKLPDLN